MFLEKHILSKWLKEKEKTEGPYICFSNRIQVHRPSLKTRGLDYVEWTLSNNLEEKNNIPFLEKLLECIGGGIL